jgi:rhamnogalacturonyl hydrolase YesR
LDYLLNVAPKAADGTISTRQSEVQLWSDFVYMAPPFIAYYGALEGGSNGAALLQTAYDQVRLYRAVLFDQGVGLWRHIALGSWQDSTHWATGNAWAAAGVLRVLATIKHSPEAGSMQSQQNDLAQWAGETLTGVWKCQVRDLLLPLSPRLSSLSRLSLNTNAHRPASKRHAPELPRPAELIR